MYPDSERSNISAFDASLKLWGDLAKGESLWICLMWHVACKFFELSMAAARESEWPVSH